jgi:endoglucanase
MLKLHFYLILFLGIIKITLGQDNNLKLKLNDSSYFETRGLNILVFSNHYGIFNDEKLSGVEIIHHGVRTATNGDVRLNPTPEQWDPIPRFIDRKTNWQDNSIEAHLSYPDYIFDYRIKAAAKDSGIILSVFIDKPLPKELEGQAGFNLEFLPSAYFEKAYMADDKSGIFPLYPGSNMSLNKNGITEPEPIASGGKIVLAPEDPYRRVIIKGKDCKLFLYDGRNKAQNGWFVVRSLIPSGKTGEVVQWFLSASTVSNWIRKPVIEYSQAGYHPDQKKIAVLEFDVNDKSKSTARLLKVADNGKFIEKIKAPLKSWGKYLRYNYSTFDFSSVKENGIYVIEYDSIRTKPFRIAKDVYENVWQPTLDIYFNVQMDHMFVREAYRVWHGAAHNDDALQAPINHNHFDLYGQGPTTDTPFKPGEHIPGLNIGGWFDAGDYDIRTQTQYYVVSTLVNIWEEFGLKRDETTIDEKTHYVEMHKPDGIPDILQQIEHGTLQLLAQFKAVGHALNGIISSHLYQYRHLGDAVDKTDNLIYNPKLDSLQSDGFTSGTFDDRWAFTNKSTPLNYGSIAALAAASRALKGYKDDLSKDCLETAKKVWDDEQAHPPDLPHFGNTTGGSLESEELKAAVELLICTKEKKYADEINGLLQKMEKQFYFNSSYFVRAIPYMDPSYSKKIEEHIKNYAENMVKFLNGNPYGVLITRGGWAGNGAAIGTAINNYILYRAFPKLINPEYVYRGLNYIYGCHPGSNISFVSGAGTVSKKIAYGNNRADFTFIAGGIVPGELIIKPDFPENKEDWPFLWGENEYVISLGASYIYLVNAVDSMLNK